MDLVFRTSFLPSLIMQSPLQPVSFLHQSTLLPFHTPVAACTVVFLCPHITWSKHSSPANDNSQVVGTKSRTSVIRIQAARPDQTSAVFEATGHQSQSIIRHPPSAAHLRSTLSAFSSPVIFLGAQQPNYRSSLL